MLISRRTSGGRGEYEISSPEPGEPRPSELVGRVICLDFGIGAPVNTGVVLTRQGGKLRLRLAGGDIQVARQAAAVLMMPEPIRADQALGAGEPVLQRMRYAIQHLRADKVLLVPPNLAIMRIKLIEVVNRSHQGEEESVRRRAGLLKAVWGHRDEFPRAIADLLGRHADAIRQGTMIDANIERLVADIQRAVSENGVDLGVAYSEAGDVLPALAGALNLDVPGPLVNPADVDAEDEPMRRSVIREWRVWASRRGPTSARFRQRVRDAYGATCAVCGAHYPPTPPAPGPGVDAAHILPWAEYDLDDIQNGLCLCKLHHWAFDESLLRVRFEGRCYLVELPEDTRGAVMAFDASFSIERLMENVGPIPASQLPANQADWPRPKFLAMLNEATG